MSILSTPGSIARSSAGPAVRDQLTSSSRDPRGIAFKVALLAALGMSVALLVILIADMVNLGAPTLTGRPGDFLTGSMRSQAESSGILQGLRGTFFIGVFTVVVSFPLGVAAAVYIEEYAHSQSRLARFIDINIRNLAGVPSVVYGILGLTIFVKTLERVTGPDSNGQSMVSGGLTLAILVLPIVIITAAEAIRAVPTGLREAGYGVGATRWEVTRQQVLPHAAPGILTGTVLALARAMGEAAPLILVGAQSGFLTGGDSFGLTELREKFTAMPMIITTWAGRPGEDWEEATAAAIVVLLVVVVIANAAAILLRNRFEKKRS